MTWHQTNGRTPRTDNPLWVMFRCGLESRYAYTRSQLRWTDTGDSFDVVAVRRA